jgi:hypothetical protein
MIKRFYFPLIVSVYEKTGWGMDWDDYIEGGGELASLYRGEIENAFDEYNDGDDMTAYFDESETAKAKIQHIEWRFESVNNCLYGRVDVALSASLTEDETEIVKDWITGQNSDGLGEGFEQRVIKVPDGEITVSFWSEDDKYQIYDENEFYKAVRSRKYEEAKA